MPGLASSNNSYPAGGPVPAGCRRVNLTLFPKHPSPNLRTTSPERSLGQINNSKSLITPSETLVNRRCKTRSTVIGSRVIRKGGDGAGDGVGVGVGVVVIVAWTTASTVADTSGVGSTIAVGTNVEVGPMVAVGIASTIALTATSMVRSKLGQAEPPRGHCKLPKLSIVEWQS